MNFKLPVTLLAAGSFMVACESTVTNVNDEAKDKATITVRIVDNHSGEAVANASVYSVVDDESEVADELGLSVWEGQVLGEHAFKISKEGYATILTTVALAEQGQGNVARVGDAIVDIPMFKTGVAAKGVVLYTDENGNLKPVKEATVYAKLPKIFVPSEVTAKTDKNGEYSFEDLPEGVAVEIYVGQEAISSKIYTGLDDVKAICGANCREGDQINVDIIKLALGASPLIKISDNLKDLDSASSVSITYSAELDADSVTNDIWVVTTGGVKVLTEVSLSKDKKTISIAPYSDKWSKNVSYSVKGKVVSVDGTSLTFNSSFSIGDAAAERPDNVKDPKAAFDEDDEYIVLSWKEPKGTIAKYNIYARENNSADYVLVGSTLAPDTDYMIDPLDYDEDVTSVKFVVLPVNADGVEADISKAKVAEIKL